MEVYRNQYNMLYYNQMLRADEKAKLKRDTHKESFSSQEVHIEDYLYVPEDWKNVFYALYFTFVPYLTGVVFLFFAVAGGDYVNFKLLDISALLIVWIIGYEIVATFLLSAIFVKYLRFKRVL